MKWVLGSWVLVCLCSGVVHGSAGIGARIDSATILPLTANLNKGRLQIRTDQQEFAAELVRSQLLYIVGHLNGIGGGADISKSKITLRALVPVDDDTLDVEYSAEFTVAWPREYQWPAKFFSVYPLRADGPGKEAFFAAYGDRCVGGDEPADAYSYFYYYRPQRQGCRLLNGNYDTKLALGQTVGLSASPLQTLNKAPEYHKVWEDGVLTATLLFGTYENGATSGNDVGVQSYNSVYNSVLKYLGKPSAVNVNIPAGQSPGLKYPDVELSYVYNDGRKVNVNMLLFQKSALLKPTPAFLERYHARTLISDFVAYNGHSGLGANIRALSKLGKFAEGRYQIFFVNGCDTFTYLDDSLTAAVAAANPGFAGTKFLDLITNALPSPFGGFGTNTVAMLSSLLGKTASYRRILSSFDSSQRPLVSGEEDNTVE